MKEKASPGTMVQSQAKWTKKGWGTKLYYSKLEQASFLMLFSTIRYQRIQYYLVGVSYNFQTDQFIYD